MTDATAIKAEPKGLGGWMIFPVMGSFLSPVQLALGLPESLNAMTTADFAGASGGFKAFVAAEIIVHIVMLGLWIYAIVLLLGRKSRFPRILIALLAAALAINIADLAIAAGVFNSKLDPQDGKVLARSLVGCLIWIPYMLRSRRVRNTFVE